MMRKKQSLINGTKAFNKINHIYLIDCLAHINIEDIYNEI